MKTRIFLAVVLAGMLSLTSVNAGSLAETAETSKTEITQKEVGTTLSQMFKTTPFEDLIDREETVRVHFSVNENSEMTNVKVDCKNRELANYVYQVLTRDKVTLANATPDNYNINIVFAVK